jgi:hypothetical protein
MLNTAELKALAAQKRLLVAESELNRYALKNEFARLRASTSQLQGVLQPGRSALLLLAPLAGFFLSSDRRPWKGLIKKIVVGWQLFGVVKRLWARFIPLDKEIKDGQSAPPPAESA